MIMKRSRFDRALDYFPIICYLFFWFQGAFSASMMTEDPRLVKLGFVTIPALAVMTVALFRIRRKNRGQEERGE